MPQIALSTPPAEAFAYAQLGETLEPLPIPQTLRTHIGTRRFGDFGTVLMAEKPASADLSERVARWRAAEVSEDLPLRAHPDQSADDRRFQFAVAVTTTAFGGWIIIGVAAAALAGKL